MASEAAMQEPLGLAAFDSLRAEDEPWLSDCYVPPRDFPLIAGARSALIFGDVGSGKTALRLALMRRWNPPGTPPRWLLVPWPVSLLFQPDLAGTDLVIVLRNQVMDAVARSLLEHLVRHPMGWGAPPPWAHETLVWFLHRYFQGDLEHAVATAGTEAPLEGQALLREILQAPPRDLLHPQAPPMLVVAELTKALRTLGIEGVRVLMDDVTPWLEMDPDRLVESLQAFLSTLALFEHPRFAYKFFLPAELESSLWSAGAVARRRVEVYRIQWWREDLIAIVEARLSLALGLPGFTLRDLSRDRKLTMWLARCGGEVPKGWLEFTRPFLAAYLAQAEQEGRRRPLSPDTSQEIKRRHPPRLFFDEETGRVTVGWRRVEDLAPGLEAMLRFLYRHRGTVCHRRPLYLQYVGAYPGSHGDPDARPAEYAGTLDTALWRLRQALEPDPKNPVLVVTVKGKGVRLENAW